MESNGIPELTSDGNEPDSSGGEKGLLTANWNYLLQSKTLGRLMASRGCLLATSSSS
jgi:hypothetical protein